MLQGRTPESYEAKRLPEVGDEPGHPDFYEALGRTLVAVNGFIYTGERADAISEAVRWLRTQPEVCVALGLRDA